jgi:hypothetical protein
MGVNPIKLPLLEKLRQINLRQKQCELWLNYKLDNLTCFEAVTSLKAILEFLADIRS